MLYELIKQPLVLMFVCAFLVFAELCIAKKAAPKIWFTNLTKNIPSPEVRRGVNFVIGVVISVGLALGEMAMICDVLGMAWLWHFAIASGFIATFVYIVIEKIWGESKANELGKIFCEVISHSSEFDGNITEAGKRELAKKIANSIKTLDKAIADKETHAIDNVVAKLDEFMADGNVTEAERAEAKKLVANAGIKDTSLLAKYRELLK